MVVIFVDKNTDNGFGYAAHYHNGGATQQDQRAGSDSDDTSIGAEQQQQPAFAGHYHHQPAFAHHSGSHYAPQGHYAPSFAHHQQHRYLLAERYKTKSCRNFMVTGACPYGHRCMFAHGMHELRTTDMNVRDGLMTEEAIRSFQRAMTAYNRGELAQMMPAEQAQFAYSSGVAPFVPQQPQQQQQASACECSDCHASRATHNPYYAAMPPAAALGQHATAIVADA